MVKSLLLVDKSLINSYDKDGLSPLQLACFRGSLPIVEFLLNCGANVNSTSHKQGYTALMFASLSGNIEIVELLLHYGARVNDVNSIGRTASQMAAFVGRYSDLRILTDLCGIPTALSVLTKAINGTIMHNARPFEQCATCGDGPELGKLEKLKACQQCKITCYCSVSCQRLHWFTHKKYCSVIKKYKKEFDLPK
ncbi:hypothetical protein MN116_003938 [Schistosoma mekongi]|uniref:MYND-type domain-containing protein n=1 Tax=Schistosoma mekongi TaxID=38744 RepID=A0AAE1ZEQ2_SCHME|nr:hypothetical protein MN116_003938 [Schistosoma mekongi]